LEPDATKTSTKLTNTPEISLIIPFYNEAESITALISEINLALSGRIKYEVITVDDGSTDDTWKVICQLSEQNPLVKGVSFRRNYGKSAALNVGFENCRGDVVITMDGDLQDSPEEIPELYRMIKKENYDLVSGWKKKRFDPLSKTIPTRLFNFATRKMSGIKLHDFNCGLKAYKSDVIKNIEVYGEMHRYIPLIAKWAGFTRVGEKVVQHQARKYGKSKFGLERFINGFLDVLSIMMVGKFGKRPMHFFGMLGTFVFLIGLLILGYLTVTKIWFQQGNMDERPLFYFGILALIIGSQLFLSGFLAELVVRNAEHRNTYQISETVGLHESVEEPSSKV